MTKAITNPELAVEKALFDAIKTFVATYDQFKVAQDYGKPFMWKRVERMFAQAAVRRTLAGNTGFRGDRVMGSVP